MTGWFWTVTCKKMFGQAEKEKLLRRLSGRKEFLCILGLRRARISSHWQVK
jgi:hypothetical protein